MKTVYKICVTGVVMLGLIGCATQAQPVYTELPRPAAKPCDAKTQLESGRRAC